LGFFNRKDFLIRGGFCIIAYISSVETNDNNLLFDYDSGKKAEKIFYVLKEK